MLCLSCGTWFPSSESSCYLRKKALVSDDTPVVKQEVIEQTPIPKPRKARLKVKSI